MIHTSPTATCGSAATEHGRFVARGERPRRSPRRDRRKRRWPLPAAAASLRRRHRPMPRRRAPTPSPPAAAKTNAVAALAGAPLSNAMPGTPPTEAELSAATQVASADKPTGSPTCAGTGADGTVLETVCSTAGPNRFRWHRTSRRRRAHASWAFPIGHRSDAHGLRALARGPARSARSAAATADRRAPGAPAVYRDDRCRSSMMIRCIGIAFASLLLAACGRGAPAPDASAAATDPAAAAPRGGGGAAQGAASAAAHRPDPGGRRQRRRSQRTWLARRRHRPGRGLADERGRRRRGLPSSAPCRPRRACSAPTSIATATAAPTCCGPTAAR